MEALKGLRTLKAIGGLKIEQWPLKEVRQLLENKVSSDTPLVYVKYIDHLLYRSMAPSNVRPAVRETVGWLMHEDDYAIWIVWDKCVKPSRYVKLDLSSGLVIVKSSILEIRRIS